MSVAVPDDIPQIILPPECQIAFDIIEVYAALRHQHWPVAAERIAKKSKCSSSRGGVKGIVAMVFIDGGYCRGFVGPTHKQDGAPSSLAFPKVEQKFGARDVVGGGYFCLGRACFRCTSQGLVVEVADLPRLFDCEIYMDKTPYLSKKTVAKKNKKRADWFGVSCSCSTEGTFLKATSSAMHG
eukprot:scaffold649_cov347-Pavlova_lutheri.AAC.82